MRAITLVAPSAGPPAPSFLREGVILASVDPTGQPVPPEATAGLPPDPDTGEADAADAPAAALAPAGAMGPVHAEAQPSDGAGTAHPDPSVPTFAPRRPMSLPDQAPWSQVPRPTLASLASAELAPGRLLDAAPRLVAPPRLLREWPAEAVQEFIMPFERGRVTSMFHQGRYHPAIDLAGPLGTPVHATTRKQRVTFAGRRGGYGNLVVTRDASGRQHYYGHLQRITVRVGAVLDQGQLLGLLGSTGHSTGPHVHYEVRTRAGRHLDPATLLFPGRQVSRGFAWNGSRSIRLAARPDQPRPR